MFIQAHIQRLLEQIGEAFKVVYFIFDAEFGHNDALQMVRQVGLPLLAKLRYPSALYLPYDGTYWGGVPAVSMVRTGLSAHAIEYLQATSIDKEIKTQLYHMSLWHKKFAEVLPIVVIVKTHRHTKKTSHVVLFSSDVSPGICASERLLSVALPTGVQSRLLYFAIAGVHVILSGPLPPPA